MTSIWTASLGFCKWFAALVHSQYWLIQWKCLGSQMQTILARFLTSSLHFFSLFEYLVSFHQHCCHFFHWISSNKDVELWALLIIILTWCVHSCRLEIERKQKHKKLLLFIYYYLFSGIQLDQPNLLKVDRSHDSISPCWWYWYCGQKCLGSYSLCWQNSLLVKTGHCGCESGSGYATVLVLGVEKSPSTKVHWVTDPPFLKYTSDCLWNGLCKFWSWWECF